MKKFLIPLALLALIACHADVPTRKVGINLGQQNAPIQLTSGNNNNVNIAPNGNTTSYIRFLVNSANSTLTGMSSATVTEGDQFWVRNDSTTGNLLITNEDTNSLAGNRFLTAGAVTISLAPRAAASVEWDSTAGRWMAAIATPGNPVFTGVVTTNGNVVANGSAIPVLTSCGTGASITAGSTDFAGTYTTGSGATTCTVTFASAFSVAPSCLIVGPGVATVVPTYTTSTTAISVTVDVASSTYQYVCVGH